MESQPSPDKDNEPKFPAFEINEGRGSSKKSKRGNFIANSARTDSNISSSGVAGPAVVKLSPNDALVFQLEKYITCRTVSVRVRI